MSDLRALPVVVGTAGHIDHGKSALVEALTGTHPDRWREERERGITLDLGYAQFAWPDGLELGFVDVPGHERLVRKMVAGATGMGAALLVVACDDGVMPQTREHFEVLQLLGIDHGIAVLSKADLADAEMRELVRADVAALLEGTVWEGCPVLEVSSHTGEGLDALRAALRKLAETVRPPAADSPAAFRLPVQRAFALHGAGTVATGVCAAGTIHEGEVVELLPAGKRSRVRRVQVHGRGAGVSGPGLRTALNLPDFEPEDCPRGAVLAAPGSLPYARLIRALVRPIAKAPRLRHGSEVLVLAHTAAVPARIWLPHEARAGGGQAPQGGWLCEFELAEPLPFVPGERLIVRRPSPGLNLAAGRFLLPGLRRLRRRDLEEREHLENFGAALDDPPAAAARALELIEGGASPAQLAAALGWTAAGARAALQAAAARGEVRQMGEERFVGMGRAGALGHEVAALLGKWRNANPHRLRIPLGHLRERLGRAKARNLEELGDEDLHALGLARRPGTEWDLVGAEPPAAVAALAAQAHAALAAHGLQPPASADLAASLHADPAALEAALVYLCDAGRALRPVGEPCFDRAAVEALRAALVAQLQAGGVDIPALRDQFGTTRKFLMPLLEWFDDRGVTARRGPNRILRDAEARLG
ncbi:MAG TPA: selenocysteine-specific translation elongation factor [Planctomycetota bacterium]